ncbi:catalase family peroxidase [Massilia aquatica]|uniref:Catalase-related peroxidase n=1 Tax=Massilia aquatica TaxID=2609000 RepID=A0ABX0M6Q0_9BURK|nr:catalase family peroxidase [Massilia aquatica]NHZ42233.1 catalase family peroxidase [Massilia aquatica]
MNQPDLYEELLDALYAIFGRHEGFRVTHAKGIVAHGSFSASPAAARLSRAAHLQGAPVPLTLRFSNFSGVPSTADGDPDAGPQGLALRFLLPDGRHTDIVAHSYDGFPVASPAQFLGFLQGIAAAGGARPDPLPLDAFLARNPRAKRYLEAPKPAPASYLAQEYFGVNSVRLLDAAGAAVHGRYRIEPVQALTAPPHAALPGTDFLGAELGERLRGGPARLRLVLQCAAPGDDPDDGSLAWPRSGPHARPEIELGILTVEMVEADARMQAARQQALAFNPGHLIDGIEASGDPMIAARAELYRRAALRRRPLQA